MPLARGLGRGLAFWRPVLSGSAPAPGQAIIDAIEATDAGPQSSTVRNAINTFVAAEIADGIWAKMPGVWGYVGGTASSHAINWKDLSVGSFVGGVTHDANGITGDGSTGYFDTGLLTDGFSQDSISLGFYSRTDHNLLEADVGTGAFFGIQIIPRYLDVNYFVMTAPQEATVANLDSRGFYSMCRRVAGTLKGYKNGANTTTASNASQALVSETFKFLCAGETGGTIERASSRNHAFGRISTGLTDAEELAHYNNVQALQTALGRQV